MSIISVSPKPQPVRFGKADPKNGTVEIQSTPGLAPASDSIELQKNTTTPKKPPYQPLLPIEPTVYHAKSVYMPEIFAEDEKPKQAMALIQKLFQQSVSHQPEDGHIKLHLGSDNRVMQHGYAWMGDMLPLMGKPVDVIAEAESEKTILLALLNASKTGGQAYMMPDSSIHITAPQGVGNKLHSRFDIQMEKRLSEQALNALATLISEKSGETDLKKIFQDIKTVHGNNKHWNALQALHYGKAGLIDGILVQDNRVITRKALDQYLQEHKLTSPEQIEQFLENHLNIFNISSQPLKQAFPESLPQKVKSNYQPIHTALLQKKKELEINGPQLYTQTKKPLNTKEQNHQVDSVQGTKEKEDIPGQSIPQQTHLYENDQSASYALAAHGKNNPQSILSNDVFFFGEEVSLKNIGKLREGLLALDSKKAQEKNPKHIQLVLSSLGGDPTGAILFSNLLRALKSPVDIIIGNRACSAGAWMLANATGYRLALPQSIVMIHEGSSNILGDGNERVEAVGRSFSQCSGRPIKEVMEDKKQEYYLNALEALLYGPKGLINGILVGGNRVITRKQAMAYLSEQLGSPEKAEQHVEKRLRQLRDPKYRPDKYATKNDPFENPLKTIHEIAKRGTTVLGEDPNFLNSGADVNNAYFEHHNLSSLEPKFTVKLNLGGLGD